MARRNHPAIRAGRTGTEERAAAQPRPAFGRRPWLALLRRARNLRRFALAMGGRIPAPRWGGPVGTVRLSSGDWAHQPVAVASSIRARRIGLRPLPLGWGLLIGGRSVHGRGLAEPLTVVGIDAAGVVVATERLPPVGSRFRIGLVSLRGAVAVLELPAQVPVPSPGTVLRWAPIPDGRRPPLP